MVNQRMFFFASCPCFISLDFRLWVRAATERKHGGGDGTLRDECYVEGYGEVQGYTHLFVVPPVVVELIKKKEMVKKFDASTLREILSGAAPLGKDVVESCTKIFPQAVVCQVQDVLIQFF